jgi:hypothetical protein
LCTDGIAGIFLRVGVEELPHRMGYVLPLLPRRGQALALHFEKPTAELLEWLSELRMWGLVGLRETSLLPRKPVKQPFLSDLPFMAL